MSSYIYSLLGKSDPNSSLVVPGVVDGTQQALWIAAASM
jgi:hypothetical protein